MRSSRRRQPSQNYRLRLVPKSSSLLRRTRRGCKSQIERRSEPIPRSGNDSLHMECLREAITYGAVSSVCCGLGPIMLDEPSRWLRSHRLSGSQLILRYLEPSSAPRPPRSGMTSARRGAKPAWCNGALRLHQQPSLRGNLAAALFGAHPPRPCVSQIYGGQTGMRRRATLVLSAVFPPYLFRPMPANAYPPSCICNLER